jgi:hypothetical protein
MYKIGILSSCSSTILRLGKYKYRISPSCSSRETCKCVLRVRRPGDIKGRVKGRFLGWYGYITAEILKRYIESIRKGDNTTESYCTQRLFRELDVGSLKYTNTFQDLFKGVATQKRTAKTRLKGMPKGCNSGRIPSAHHHVPSLPWIENLQGFDPMVTKPIFIVHLEPRLWRSAAMATQQNP